MLLTPVKHFVTLKVLVLLQNQKTQWLWELDILPPFLHYEPLLKGTKKVAYLLIHQNVKLLLWCHNRTLNMGHKHNQ